MRLRELIKLPSDYKTGPLNQICDVAGVKLSQFEIYQENPCLRTGLTLIFPSQDCWQRPICAGFYSFHGYAEFSGAQWIQESGRLDGPIALTSTSCQGVVRDALFRYAARRDLDFSYLPVCAETDDSYLSDCSVESIQMDHVFRCIDSASTNLREGNAGGGMGMICHEFKGGTGSSSRLVELKSRQYTIGCLVQSNYGERAHLRLDGVPVGHALDYSITPSSWDETETNRSKGSILVILAVDAPLLPNQLRQLCMRASLGLGRVGGFGSYESGDLFLAFSTAQQWSLNSSTTLLSLAPCELDRLFEACVEVVEESIWNAILQAETMVGLNGRKAHKINTQVLTNCLQDSHLKNHVIHGK